MSVRVKVTSAGITRMRARVSMASNFLTRDGMSRVMNDQAKSLEQEFKNQILSFTPGRVQDLSPAYKEIKQNRHGLIYPILVASGGMLNAIRVRAVLTSQGWLMRLGFVGNAPNGSDYNVVAEAHITGSGRLPKRDFSKVTPAWRKALIASIRNEVFSLLRGK